MDAAGAGKLELAGREMTGATPLTSEAATRGALAAAATEGACFCTLAIGTATTAEDAEAGKATTSADDAGKSAPLAALAGSANSIGKA